MIGNRRFVPPTLLTVLLLVVALQPEALQPGIASSTQAPMIARKIKYKVVGQYPHDTGAFLQGLVWHDGGFYESTGLLGESELRRVKFPSGQVTKRVSLPSDVFGEGLAMMGDRLVQLTWQSNRGFVYDRETLTLEREFAYEAEGWGLTFDGENLILSDGSNTLTYLDAATFQPVRRLDVTWDGTPLYNLNELEFIEGEIWANVWQTDHIVQIEPSTGEVISYLDLKGLSGRVSGGPDDVLNGIAYDARKKRIFVSGKRWPWVFRIKLKNK
jgi:glutaminyl-peptide cyclotransferase